MKCKLKICGVTSHQDAINLVNTGVDALGVNFWNKSKRYISPEKAKPFLDDVKGGIQRVGVFVNEDIDKIIEIYEAGLIDTVQLHGDEDHLFYSLLTEKNIDVIKVIRVPKNSTEIIVPDHLPQNILLDSLVSGYGGAGESFNWNIAKDFIKNNSHKKVIIAGGITVENIQKVAHIEPYMIDVASGAEYMPGLKNLELVTQMLKIIKN